MDRKRGKILKYNQEDLEKAVKAVQAGESIRQAATLFNVPRSTIGDRISGRFSMEKPLVHGRPPAIPTEIENKIVESVKMAAKLGVGLSRKHIITRTNVLCKRIKIQTSYTNFKAGKDWWEGVKRRHPEITIRKPEKLSSVRARMMNPSVVNNYFNDLGKVVEELNLSAMDIWNCDETGLNFEHSPVRVVAERGSSVVSKTSQKSSNVTIMACVNAFGSSMPPLIITKGKTVKSLHGFNIKDAPTDTFWSYQDKGWMTDEIGEKWFNNVFLTHCGPKRPQLLIFDGHTSHETLSIIERAIDENIVLMSLPPHTTHYLQPLDRSVFGPLKKSYNDRCSEFMSEHPLHVINKHTFPSILSKAWDDALTEKNIRSGFASCGIWPVDRSAVPAEAFTPSSMTDVPHVPDTTSSRSTRIDITSSSSTSTSDTTNMEEALEILTAVPLSLSENEIPAELNISLPILDISDPVALLELISSGSFLMDETTPNEVVVGLEEADTDVDASISDVFLPPKLEKRTEHKTNIVKKTSHTILTSDEIVTQKRGIQLLKTEKELKKSAKRIKKEKK